MTINWKDRPVAFAKLQLGIQPWKKQREILYAIANHHRVAVRSCNGSGKTLTAAIATLWWITTHQEAIVITTAPTQRQVGKLLWKEIHHLHSINKQLPRGKTTYTSLEISEKRYAFGFSTKDTAKFQGFHNENLLVIVDEAAGVDDDIFDAIYGCMTTENSKLLLIGNPQYNSGTFYDAFHSKRDLWKTIHISAFDTPAFQKQTAAQNPDAETELKSIPPGMVTPRWVHEFAQHNGEHSPTYQFRVLGQFPSNSIDTLISLKHIEKATNRQFDTSNQHQTIMGLDVARFGDAKTIAIIRKGPQVIDIVEMPPADLMETAGRTHEIANKHNVDKIFVDKVGIGAGVVDRLNEIGKNKAIGINAGNKARNTERFANLRAQMFNGLKERFEQDDIAIPNDNELISQLASLKYSYTSRGQLQIQSKQQMRDAGLKSPDKADAMTLAFTAPEPPKIRMWIGQPRETENPRQRNRRTRLP